MKYILLTIPLISNALTCNTERECANKVHDLLKRSGELCVNEQEDVISKTDNVTAMVNSAQRLENCIKDTKKKQRSKEALIKKLNQIKSFRG